MVALAGYAGLESILVVTGKIRNFFELVDKNQSCGKEIIFLMGVPLILALLLKLIASRLHNIDIPFGFILGGLWFVCALHTYVNYVIFDWLSAIKSPNQCFKNINFSGYKAGQTLLWVIAILVVIGAMANLRPPTDPYGNFSCGPPYAPTYQTLVENYQKMGVWYASPVPKSEEYPQGFGRLATGFGMGNGILCVIVANCGFDVKKLYWGILILGSVLLAFVAGGIVCRNPIGFAAISIALLTGCTTFLYIWVSARAGMVEMLVLGMAFVVTLPYVIRYRSYSTIIWWSLMVGIVSGIAGLMRQNTGLSILAASMLVIIIFASIKHKKIILTLTAVVAIIVGNALIWTTFKGVSWYRDAKLEITAPTTSIYTHGAGLPLLGGIGGVHPPDAPPGLVPYPNLLDMAFWDPVMYINVHNESPLVFYIDSQEVAEHQISFKILQRYIFEHPIEFLTNVIRKAYLLLELVVQDATKGWLSALLVLIMLGGLGKIKMTEARNRTF